MVAFVGNYNSEHYHVAPASRTGNTFNVMIKGELSAMEKQNAANFLDIKAGVLGAKGIHLGEMLSDSGILLGIRVTLRTDDARKTFAEIMGIDQNRLKSPVRRGEPGGRGR